jgi:hypothetical protein
VGNLVHSNNQDDSPAITVAVTTLGNGIVIAGGIDNVVERNLIYDHRYTGITLTVLPDEQVWPATGNRIQDNVVLESGLVDVAVFAEAGDGNCFSGNELASTWPADLQTVLPCDGPAAEFPEGEPLDEAPIRTDNPPSGDYQTTPVPPDQPSMPDAETAPARPATDVPMAVDLDAITVPSRPAEE